jgi:hypothetical protein
MPLLCFWLIWGVWWVKSVAAVDIKSKERLKQLPGKPII